MRDPVPENKVEGVIIPALNVGFGPPHKQVSAQSQVHTHIHNTGVLKSIRFFWQRSKNYDIRASDGSQL